MLVDHHAHWLPEAVLELLSRRSEPPLTWRDQGRWVFQAAMKPRVLDRAAFDLDHRAGQLEALGIDMQVLSWSPLWNLDALPTDSAMAVARAFNDATAARSADGRYRGMAVAPLADMGAAVSELRRAAALGLDGFVLPAWCLCDTAQADSVAAWFDTALALRMRVFVHPGRVPAFVQSGGTPDQRHLHRHLGLAPQHEIGLAMLTLCQEGWLAQYPGVSVQFANGGGSFPPAMERLERMAEDDSHSASRRTRLLAQVIVDTASLGAVGIRASRALLGSDSVVLGTDAPIFDTARATDDWRLAGC